MSDRFLGGRVPGTRLNPDGSEQPRSGSVRLAATLAGLVGVGLCMAAFDYHDAREQAGHRYDVMLGTECLSDTPFGTDHHRKVDITRADDGYTKFNFGATVVGVTVRTENTDTVTPLQFEYSLTGDLLAADDTTTVYLRKQHCLGY